MLFHLDRLESWQNDEIIYPIYVAFSPSSLCNHKCTFCVYHYKQFEPIFFPLERYKTLVDEFSEKGVKSLFFAGDGEPLLNKDCIEMIEYTRKKGLDIAMNTNARLIKENQEQVLVRDLDWIRVSVNGGDAQTYAKIHQCAEKDFDIVLKNLERLVNEKRKQNSDIVIGAQCVLLNENKHTIRPLAHKLKEIGVDYLSIKPFLKHPDTTWTTELEDKEDVVKDLTKLYTLNDEKFSFAIRESNFFESPKREYNKCLSGRFMIEIDARGDIYSCGPYIGNADHRYGNILKNTFKEVWEGEECSNRIKDIQCNLDVSKCMPNCRPNSVNEFLWNIKNPPQHVNFI